ncbi:hypothetical protein TWF481_000180 [Arthrobotrys musiformis]|uniref:Uncharacterized protein n=1 Tax=Arthrobotrys musiformis TaxID=47236 RepID=A0AAV9WLU8_9PEZI
MWALLDLLLSRILQGSILAGLLISQLAQSRILRIEQVLFEDVLDPNGLKTGWTYHDSWSDRDLVWQYGNDGSCTGFFPTLPGALLDTVRFSFANPNFGFPWYLDHNEIHRTKQCEDPQPLKIPIESEKTLLDMNPDLAFELSSRSTDSGEVLTQYETEVSSPQQNSPPEATVENQSEILSSPNPDDVQSILDNEAASSQAHEVQNGDISGSGTSQKSLSDYHSAPARLETPTSELDGDILTWRIWPMLQIPMPISVRFVTNYHKKRDLPLDIDRKGISQAWEIT